MKFNGHIDLNSNGSGYIRNAFIEQATTTTRDSGTGQFVAGSLVEGRIIYNTTDGVYQFYDGASWVNFASGGDATAIQNEVDALEASLGPVVGTDGVFDTAALDSGAYMDASTNITEALLALDTALQSAAGVDTLAELTDVTISTSGANELLFTTAVSRYSQPRLS
jgi:hypothetical protein